MAVDSGSLVFPKQMKRGKLEIIIILVHSIFSLSEVLNFPNGSVLVSCELNTLNNIFINVPHLTDLGDYTLATDAG